MGRETWIYFRIIAKTLIVIIQMSNLFLEDMTDDIIIWGPSHSGTNTTKSAHEWFMEEPNVDT